MHQSIFTGKMHHVSQRCVTFRPAHMRHTQCRRGQRIAVRAAQEVKIIQKDNSVMLMEQPTLLIGSSAAANLRVAGNHVAEQHAQLELKGGRLLCTALAAKDPDSMLSATYTWLDGVEQRPGVAYMVAPGSTLAFGTPDNSVRVEFEEQGGAGGVADMLMQGMLAGASQEVKKQFESMSNQQ